MFCYGSGPECMFNPKRFLTLFKQGRQSAMYVIHTIQLGFMSRRTRRSHRAWTRREIEDGLSCLENRFSDGLG